MAQIATKKATYKDRYKKELKEEFIRTNKYNEIYNNYIDMKEYLILNMSKFCKPEELEQLL